MAATQYGHLQEFHPETDSVKKYLECVSLYFMVIEVPNEKKVAILLSSIGASTYALLSDLVAPESPGDKTLDQISTALTNYFEPQRSTIAERFHFHKHEQAIGKSVTEFDAALRKLALHCDFKGKLDEMLHDRFVCGLRHELMQRRLLSEPLKLTYQKALDIAKAMEAADKSTKTFKGGDAGEVNKLGTKGTGNLPKTCYRCGRPNHKPSEYKFKEAECHACRKTGHIATACRSKPPRSKKAYPRRQTEGQTMFLVRTRRPVKQISAARNINFTRLRDALTQTLLL